MTPLRQPAFEEFMMRPKENLAPFIKIALGLTLAILVTFQVYILREPARIQADMAADRAVAVASGRELYIDHCAACHGENGEGGIGPALNSKGLLAGTADAGLFNLARTGIPGTVMPAWSQSFGGPFTDEQIDQIVAFIRAWEPTAPAPTPPALAPDPVRGAALYARTCFICHGEDGQGTDKAPALNDPKRLGKLEDGWYRNTIAHGRPAKGMPTWGTVLSPAQIDDLVALIAAWREGQTVSPATSLATYLTNALFAIQEFDQTDAQFYLNQALTQADGAQAEEIKAVIDLIQENRLYEAGSRLTTLLPPEEMGQAAFESNCAACHGSDGSGGIGPNLHNNSFVQSKSDEELVAFILAGRTGTAMNGFEGILTEDTLYNVIALLRAWQE
jgi:mono/diheme cytochrome c family protein